MYSIHTHSGKLEKREWGSCENIASRYLKRLERKYGAIFYSFQPVRVSKASPVQWTFTVHANTHTEMHTQTHIELLNQNPGVTEWVVNICLLLDLKQLVDYSCVCAIFFFSLLRLVRGLILTPTQTSDFTLENLITALFRHRVEAKQHSFFTILSLGRTTRTDRSTASTPVRVRYIQERNIWETI